MPDRQDINMIFLLIALTLTSLAQTSPGLQTHTSNTLHGGFTDSSNLTCPKSNLWLSNPQTSPHTQLFTILVGLPPSICLFKPETEKLASVPSFWTSTSHPAARPASSSYNVDLTSCLSPSASSYCGLGHQHLSPETAKALTTRPCLAWRLPVSNVVVCHTPPRSLTPATVAFFQLFEQTQLLLQSLFACSLCMECPSFNCLSGPCLSPLLQCTLQEGRSQCSCSLRRA